MAKFEVPQWHERVSLYDSISENLYGEGEQSLLQHFFHSNVFYLLKIQTVINSQSLIMGTSNLAILLFSASSFHS